MKYALKQLGRLLSILLLINFCNNLKVMAQTNLFIKGKITTEGTQASVTVRSKHSGTIQSDSAGNFAMQVKKLPDTLSFELLGFVAQTRVINVATSILYINLVSEQTTLNEVVVNTGYQLLKPNEVTGAISTIDAAALNSRTGTNILDRLLGQSTGLLLNIGKENSNPQNSTNLSVRGMGTINGPLDPLIVLDGFIYEGDINNINPNDVASISILKDAAAASIWGARAGNGVIVITTKKPKYGEPLKINFTSTHSISQIPNFDLLNSMDATDYIGVEKFLFNKGFFDNQIASTPYLALTPALEVLLKQRQGKLSEAAAQGQLAQLATYNSNDAYRKEFYTNAFTQQYALSLSNSNEKFANMLSAGYDHTLSESYAKTERLNVKYGFEYRPLPKLNIAANAYLTFAKNKGGRPTVNSIRTGGRLLPYLQFRDANGNPLSIDVSYRGAYTDTLLNGRLLDWKYYPTEEYKQRQSITQREEINANFRTSYQLFDFLSLNLSYQYQKQHIERDNSSDATSYQARDMVNLFTQYDKATNTFKYIVPIGGIMDNQYELSTSNTLRMQANFNHNNYIHGFNAIIGAEQRAVANEANGSVKYGYYADPLNFREIDPVNAYPTLLTGSTRQINSTGSLTATDYRFISYYANIAYAFLNRYNFSASIRNDGSNIFGAKTNDKWKPLWSVGLNWDVAKEPFYKITWLPKLSFKATYGYSGNVDLTKTALPIAAYGTNPTTGLPIAKITSINNPNLTWEKLGQLNLGINFATNRNFLYGGIAYFVKKGKDLYGLAPYDYTGWGATSELVRNVAAMKGNGIEADLHLSLIQKSKLRWGIDGYFNYNTAKTTEYFNTNSYGLFNLLGSGQTITPLVGQPLYAMAAYKWAGLDAQGNPQGFLNGKPSVDYEAIANEARTTGANISLVGPTTPTYYGSFINKFNHGNFGLQFNISYRLGYYAKKSTINYNNLVNNGTGHSDYALRWQKPGDEYITDVPAMVYPVNASRDNFYSLAMVNTYRADHIRLDNISFTYVINTRKKASLLNKAEFFLNLQNVGVLWKASSTVDDPDYQNNIPPIRNLSLGLRTSF